MVVGYSVHITRRMHLASSLRTDPRRSLKRGQGKSGYVLCTDEKYEAHSGKRGEGSVDVDPRIVETSATWQNDGSSEHT
jgi:hypothetical protein